MDENYFRKVMTTIILVFLIVLSFFLLKPILLSIIIACILAFIFTPVYCWTIKKVKSENLAAVLICIFLALLILLPVWFLTPMMIDQSFKVFQASQQIDFVKPLKTIFPNFFSSEAFSNEVASTLRSFATKVTNSLVNELAQFILNFPTIFLQFLVVFFTFFFVLRDKDELISYIQSLLPFSKDIENKLFESSKDITISVIYGQVIVGLLQGLAVGVGFLIFKVPNALFLTLLACLAGVFPIIGTSIVWAPVVIYLLIAGNAFPAFGVVIFGLISMGIDNLVRPIIVAKKTRMHSALILIGMIGGVFLFGILGFILGPLILAYLLIILEIYRGKKSPAIFMKQ
ncbi:MAG: AI-2E family transporter [Nanoarchaeota archaeon]